MSSRQLTPDQARKLHDALFPHVNYLLRLRRRLEELRFPPGDPLLIVAARAYDAAWELSRVVHEQSIRMGSGGRRSAE